MYAAVPDVLNLFFWGFLHEENPFNCVSIAIGLSPKVKGYRHLVIHKSRIFHSESLNCGGGIHGALKSDPKRFGARFAIALATKEAA